MHAGDREGLERLCRYGVRPCFSLERLSVLADGRVAYRLRKPRSNGATHLVMTPVHFLARLAELVPPPRFPLLRFAGVLAPNSLWRSAVVPGDARAGVGVTRVNPSSAERKAEKRTGAKGKSATTSPILTEHDRPKGIAPALPPADSATAPRTSLGAGVVPQPYARIVRVGGWRGECEGLASPGCFSPFR